MSDIELAYNGLIDSFNFDESSLDYSILDKHIESVSELSKLSNNSITIFDNFKRKHAFVSPNHRELFGCNEHGDIQIHPEDFETAIRNAITCIRHFFVGNKNATNHKLIREFRVNINGVYRRVTEQIQLLEIDSKGNPWLSLSIMDISPNQSPPFRVDSKLINFKTGDFISPVDKYFDRKSILSEREIVVLKLIHEGMLSKEISDKLCISVHTVNTHRQRILEKLKVDTSLEAVKYAMALGLLDE
jgi:Response regulator containing a CheY-like receiver domain and an HTH DNA-binding domain